MVVDDAIVVLENVTTHIKVQFRLPSRQLYGTNEVAISVMASTLAMIAVFFPLTRFQVRRVVQAIGLDDVCHYAYLYRFGFVSYSDALFSVAEVTA